MRNYRSEHSPLLHYSLKHRAYCDHDSNLVALADEIGFGPGKPQAYWDGLSRCGGISLSKSRSTS